MNAAGSWIEVDRGALAHNIRAMRALVGSQVRIFVPVKADGYGHGAVETAQTVLEAGADRVGVARVGEGVQLRQAGIGAPVHVLEPFHPDDLEAYLAHDLVPTVCTPEAASALDAAGRERGRAVRAHLKVDTGMGRLGLHAESDRETILAMAALPGVEWEGLFTHFARADEPDLPHTDRQLGRFRGLEAALATRGLRPPILHAANSAALFLRPDARFEMVRPGLATYGYDPTEGRLPSGVSLRPALRLYSTVRHLTWVEPGDEVSYGGIWTASRRTRVAAIPLGYGDGFWRTHSNRLEVEVGGVLVPQIGRICMDIMMLDVTEVPGIALGDRVAVIDGERDARLSAERLARNQGTIVYEVTCDLGRRLERRFVDSPV